MIILLISAVILALAYIMEHFFDIHPCQMCLYERNVFIGTAGIAFVSLISLPEHSKYYAIMALGFIFMGELFLLGIMSPSNNIGSLCPLFAHLLT
jgi:disulfide bond formation protein DsbB